VEYALECELTASSALPVTRFGNNPIDMAGEFASGTHRFPRYVIGPPAELRDTYMLLYRDFWNSIGVATEQDDFLLDMPEAAAG
jgi:hypothetical protein